MNAIIDEDLLDLINAIKAEVTTLPRYDSGETASQPDYLFAGVFVYFDISAKTLYHPIVSLRFQSTFEDTYRYYMIDTNYDVYQFSEVIL